MGKNYFDIADSIFGKLIDDGWIINLDIEFENSNLSEDDRGYLCREINHRIRVWYLETSMQFHKAELEDMRNRVHFTQHAIRVFEDAEAICATIMSR